MPQLSLSPRPAADADADLLVLPVAGGDDGPRPFPATRDVLDRLGADLGMLAQTGGFTGALDQTLLVPGFGAIRAGGVLLTGVGPDADRTDETLRRAASVAARELKGGRVATALHQAGGGPAALAAVAEGFTLAAYRFERYRSEHDPVVAEVALLVDEATADLEGVLRRAEVAAQAALLARDLVNEPANTINPATLAAAAVRVAGEAGLTVEVLEGQALAQGGFGGVLAVGAGSAVPPRIVVLGHRPEGATRRVALVGKGVTFDTGGLDLKRGEHMDGMKDDMAGAASVLAVMRALAALDVHLEVTGVLPLVENMPGGSAMRAGDVIRVRNHTTIEITNTDAEGRLILADGLALAAEAEPDAIVDLATLTGSAMVGLGPGCTAVMGNSPPLVARLLQAARRTGELAGELPLVEDYRRWIDSDVADLRNATEHLGDAIQAGLFLREFVAGRPWVHLDIAGPATAKQAFYYQPKGGTGCMVRTVLALLEEFG